MFLWNTISAWNVALNLMTLNRNMILWLWHIVNIVDVMQYMNIAAFIIALVGGIVFILQSGCLMLIGGVMSGLDKNTEPVAGGAFLCFVAAILAIIVGSLSLRNSSAGWKTLCAAAIISILGGLSFYGYKDAYFR